MTRPRIGLALGSGSARGWAHIGVIDSLIGDRPRDLAAVRADP
jgi:NTE family protein